MAEIKHIRISVKDFEMNADMFFKILRCIKKHEPEIWSEIKATTIDGLESALGKVSTGERQLTIPDVTHPVCHLCKDTGWIFIPNFGGGGTTERCLCGANGG
jgi:hypothetical protein